MEKTGRRSGGRTSGNRGCAAASIERAGRMARDIEAIAGFTEDGPARRPQPAHVLPVVAHRRATTWRGEAAAAVCEVRVDAAGNLHARPRAWDGRTRRGCAGPTSTRSPPAGSSTAWWGWWWRWRCCAPRPAAAVELIVFAEEEGTTFNLGMLGSRAWAGARRGGRAPRAPQQRRARTTSARAPRTGWIPSGWRRSGFAPADYLGLIEAHVEQGPGLWNAGEPVAVVTAIAGRRQYLCTLRREANHAGATRMADRRDALAGAAEAVTGAGSPGPRARTGRTGTR